MESSSSGHYSVSDRRLLRPAEHTDTIPIEKHRPRSADDGIGHEREPPPRVTEVAVRQSSSSDNAEQIIRNEYHIIRNEYHIETHSKKNICRAKKKNDAVTFCFSTFIRFGDTVAPIASLSAHRLLFSPQVSKKYRSCFVSSHTKYPIHHVFNLAQEIPRNWLKHM